MIWVLCALLAGLPFEYYIRGPGSSLLTTLKLQWALLAAAWGGAILRRWAAAPRNFISPVPVRLLAAAAVLAATQVLSALFAAEFPANAAKAAVKSLLGVATMIAAADVIRNSRPGAGRKVLAALSATTACAAAIGLGSLWGVEPLASTAGIFQDADYHAGAHVRLTSTMEYPNTAAAIFAAGLFASVALALPDGTLSRRHLCWLLAAVLQGAALVLTYSRGALLSVTAGMIVCVAVIRPLRSGRSASLIAGTAALLAAVGYVGWIRQGTGEAARPKTTRAALYGFKAAEEIKHLAPDRIYRETLGVRNTSQVSWPSGSFGIGYRWYELRSARIAELMEGGVFRTGIPRSGQQALEVTFRSPGEEGEYLLIWYVVRRDPALRALEHSYSPAVICTVSRPGSSPAQLSPRAASYLKDIRRERRGLLLELNPSRAELWRAAAGMFLEKPVLGAGPDNFRLLKGRFMSAPDGDERILANSLYLEFLAGSGLLGLAALLWFGWEIARLLAAQIRRAADFPIVFFSTAYFTSFFVHGLADYFLKFTPTFLLFWIAAGVAAGTYGTRESR